MSHACVRACVHACFLKPNFIFYCFSFRIAFTCDDTFFAIRMTFCVLIFFFSKKTFLPSRWSQQFYNICIRPGEIRPWTKMAFLQDKFIRVSMNTILGWATISLARIKVKELLYSDETTCQIRNKQSDCVAANTNSRWRNLFCCFFFIEKHPNWFLFWCENENCFVFVSLSIG